MQQIHKNIAQAIVEALPQIFEQGKYADHLVGKLLKSNPKWGSRDRKFIAEAIYEIVRWWRYYLYLSEQDYQDKQETAVNYWHVFGVYLVVHKDFLPEWTEFETLSEEKILINVEKASSIVKVKQSIPDWLDKLGQEQFAEQWEKEISALNEPAQVIIRVNTLKISVKELKNILSQAEIETTSVPNIPNVLILNKRQNISQTEAYKNGYFEIQDASSQTIAPTLQAEPNMFIIDACAGAGGKSLHIASLIKNKGKILALDIEGHKLQELQKRATKAGATCIETALINQDVIERYTNTADRLLLDVPCSGLGTLRRSPDAKWKLNEIFIEEIQITQQQILNDYSVMLKKGGLLVYATCSILYIENKQQIENFLATHKGKFELLSEQNMMPSDGFDGFYCATLKKLL